MKDTLCWKCSYPYSETWGNCPKCLATNANVNLKSAMTEMNRDRQDLEREYYKDKEGNKCGH